MTSMFSDPILPVASSAHAPVPSTDPFLGGALFLSSPDDDQEYDELEDAPAGSGPRG